MAGEGSDPRPKKPPAHAPAEHVQCMYIVHTLNTPTGGHGQWPVPAAREKQSGDILHIQCECAAGTGHLPWPPVGVYNVCTLYMLCWCMSRGFLWAGVAAFPCHQQSHLQGEVSLPLPAPSSNSFKCRTFEQNLDPLETIL